VSRAGSAAAALAFFLLLALTVACGREEPTPLGGAPVVVAPVELRDVEERIEATGELLAKDQARIAAEVPGRVTQILRDEGEGVQAGEVVLEIDPERRRLELQDARARVSEAQAALRDKEREAKRVRELHRKDVASEAQLDQAETGLELTGSRLAAARAQLGVAERALRDASVAAPFAGLVSRRLVSVGEFVQAGTALFELVALDPIEVEFHLAEKDSSRVAVGHSLSVQVSPHPDRKFPAVVNLVSPTIDPRTRTLRVKAELTNPDGLLKPGLFARVDLGVARRSGVPTIPEEAVLYRADGAVVFRVGEGNRVERRAVEIGLHLDGAVEVVQGLAGGDVVVRRGHAELVEGALVEPRRPDGTPLEATATTTDGGPEE
jgi:membrane fusion protein (multidrug efflux system)